jgi:hypothetical protein
VSIFSGLFYHFNRCSKERKELIALLASYRESSQENLLNFNMTKVMYDNCQKELLEQKGVVDYTLLEKEQLAEKCLKLSAHIDHLNSKINRLKSKKKIVKKEAKNGRRNATTNGQRDKPSVEGNK